MKTKDITLTGLMAALIFIGTFFFKIPSPFGYNHFGDGFMLLTVFMLGYKKAHLQVLSEQVLQTL